MARYLQIVSGNASDSTKLSTMTAVATAHASNTTGDFVSSSVNTDTFTAPNLVNKAVGVGIFLTSNNLSTGAVIRATLQEDVGAGFVDTACTADITITAGLNDTANIYLTFIAGTPYTFMTTTANKYRWKIVKQSGTGILLRARSSNTGSTTAWAFFYDDRTGTPSTSDDIFVANSVATTLTNGMSFGTGAGTSQSDAPNTFSEKAFYILTGATSDFDATANTTVTIKGMINVAKYGKFRIGTESVAYSSSYVAKLIHDMNGTAGNYGIWTADGDIILNGGYQPANYAVNYVSGSGTAASPMITTGDIGAVGDEVCIAGTGNYNQTEYKFIKTKNSATSYVLSDTSGGAEAALVNTHSTRAKVLNLQRNIIIEPSNTAHPNYILHIGSSINGKFYGKNFRTNYIGNSGIGKFGVTLGYSSGASTMVVEELSGIVSYRTVYSGIYLQSSRSDYTTYTDNIFVRGGSPQPIFQTYGAANKILTRWYCVDNNASHWGGTSVVNMVFNELYSYCANTGNGSNGGHFLSSSSSAKVTFNNCDFQWARQGGIRNLSISMSQWQFNNCSFGDVGTNIIDIYLNTGSTMDVTFTNCTFGSPTLISGYTLMNEGSEVRFQRFNQSATSHRWYTPHGMARTETSVVRTGAISLAIEPEDTTGFVWEFRMPANGNQQVFLPGYYRRNTGYTNDVIVDIYLPYSTTPDETLTLGTVQDAWTAFITSQDYSESENELAIIKITAKGTAGNIIYFDDFLNAGNTTDVSNNIASFETWFNGKPVDLFSLIDVSAIPDLAALKVWNDTNTYDAGTKGKDVKDASKAKLLL